MGFGRLPASVAVDSTEARRGSWTGRLGKSSWCRLEIGFRGLKRIRRVVNFGPPYGQNIRRERFGFYNTNNRRDRTPVLWRPESRGREHDRWFAFVSGNLGCFRAQGIFWLATAPARFLLVELGEGAGKAVGTFARLVARYGLKNVPTPIEIIAELLACHAGAITYPRPATGRCAGGPPSSGPRVKTASVLDSNVTPAWGRLLVGDTPGRLMSSEAAFHVAGRCAGDRGRRNGKLKHAEAG